MRNMECKPVPTGPYAPPGSLAAALATVPDPRRPYGWRPAHAPIPLVALLQVMVATTLCGARSLYAIAQWAAARIVRGAPLMNGPAWGSSQIDIPRLQAYLRAISPWVRGRA